MPSPLRRIRGDDIKKKHHPDQETLGRKEQRPFEILLAPWDVPVVAALETAP
jgi:hypothetical protein